MRCVIIFILLCLSLIPSFAFGAEEQVSPAVLKVYYLEFPPYYYTNNDRQPDGFLLKKTEAILQRAGIESEYDSVPAKRILQDMRKLEPTCSIGWFKTPQRERFAQFSKPIYQNKPLQILYLKQNESLFRDKTSLAQVMADETLVFGQLESYSLGPVVDHMIKKSSPETRLVVGGYPQLVRMLAAQRFSYLLAAPEGIDILIEKNRLVPELFVRQSMADIPAGNLRHLMFSRGVSDETIIRINRAIDHLK